MERFKMVFLWIIAILFCLNIYKDGHTMYYHYQNNDGWGFNCESYRGETITKWWNLYDSEKCRYVGTRKIFDKQPKTRKLLIVMILGLSAFLTFRMNRKQIKKQVSTVDFIIPLVNHQTKTLLVCEKKPEDNKTQNDYYKHFLEYVYYLYITSAVVK